jgi:glutathione reductase (NADPH)
MLYATEFATEMQAAKGFGWIEAGSSLEWHTFLEAKREELLRLNKAYTDNLNKSGVELLQGRGVVTGHHEVEVDGRKISTRNIVIATGGQSSHIPVPGAEHAITSDQVLELDSIPRVVTLIGGGYIGMEFAGMFARLGCEVHVVARQELPLAPRFDGEVCRFFKEQVQSQAGIHMHMSSNPTEIIKESDGTLTVKLDPINKDKDSSSSSSSSSGSSSEIRGNQQVVLAVGRAAKTKGLGLEELGVEMGPKGSIKVDEFSRTNIPSIWGVGDVTSRIALTPVAIMEGQALGQSLATDNLVAPDYENVPSACFSWPFVATVGLTEEQAKQQELSFEVYTSRFTPLKARIAAKGTGKPPLQCMIKMLVEVGSGKVLGLHMVGEDAPEIIQGFALSIKLGVTKQQLDSLVGIHPTAGEEVLGLKGPDRTVNGASKPQEAQQKAQAHSRR